jgi:hypothetical protein
MFWFRKKFITDRQKKHELTGSLIIISFAGVRLIRKPAYEVWRTKH